MTGMNRRQALRVVMGSGAALATAVPAAAPALQWRERGLLAFGTTVWLQAGHANPAVATAGIDAAVAAVQRVDQQMSLFRPDSLVSQLNREGVLHQPPADLLGLLRLAARISAASAGAFDATVQPLWALWARAHSQGRRPSAAELSQARALVDWRGVQLKPQAIRLARPGMAITLNGIAQGHAADMARQALLQHGVADALLDTGEWWPMGASADAGPWRLGVHDPHAMRREAGATNAARSDLAASRSAAADAQRILGALIADGRALACSSDDKLSFSADHRDHHILDPRSGSSPTQLSTVVVAAPSAALADGLTKPMFMGSAADALALARRWSVDVLTVDKAGRIAMSPGLKLLPSTRA